MEVINQNFEGVKIALNEGESFYLSVSKQIRYPTLAFFPPEADLPLADNLIFSVKNPMQFLQRIFYFQNNLKVEN